MEDGSSHPSCGTMDADLTLSGVDCAVEKTDTATRTILCEAGGNCRILCATATNFTTLLLYRNLL